MLDAYLIFKLTGILLFAAGGAAAARSCFGSLLKSFFATATGIFCGYFGSTFWYIFQNENWRSADSLMAWAGLMDGAGSVLYGWILGGTAGVWIVCRLFKIDFLSVLDRLAPWLLTAQILNRFGCFSGECCYGRLSHVPWAVHNSILGGRVHPVQLYEALWDALVLGMLLRIRLSDTGKRTLFYFIAYPAGRFALETFRGDNGPAFAGLTVPQLTSLALILIVLPLWFRRTGKV